MSAPLFSVLGIKESEERLIAIGRGVSEERFDAVSRAAKLLERAVKVNLRSGRYGLTSKKKLRQSFTSAAFTAGKKVVGVVGSALVYARIHELGGKIRPVNVSYLTIPLGRLKGKNARASDFSDLFFFKSEKTKKAFLVRPKGKDQLEFLFLLKKLVKIRPKKYLEQTAKAEQVKIVRVLNSQVAEIVVRGGKP